MMNFYIDHKHKLVFYWPTKCGVTAVIELIMLIGKGELVTNKDDDKTHEYYYASFKKWHLQKLNNISFDEYKIVLVTRNPYHRIVSCFLDKFVCPDSPTLNKVCSTRTYGSFLNSLKYTKFDRSLKKADPDFYHHFAPAAKPSPTFNKLMAHLSKRGKPDFLLHTPSTALPEGKIPFNFDQQAAVLEDIGRPDLLDSLRKLDSHVYGLGYWQLYSPKLNFEQGKFFRMPIKDLVKYTTPEKNRTIPYSGFYSWYLKKLLSNIYQSEFNFYKSLGLRYDIQL